MVETQPKPKMIPYEKYKEKLLREREKLFRDKIAIEWKIQGIERAMIIVEEVEKEFGDD